MITMIFPMIKILLISILNNKKIQAIDIQNHEKPVHLHGLYTACQVSEFNIY